MHNQPLPDATLKSLEQAVLRGGDAADAAVETLDAELAGAGPDYADRLREIIAFSTRSAFSWHGHRPASFPFLERPCATAPWPPPA